MTGPAERLAPFALPPERFGGGIAGLRDLSAIWAEARGDPRIRVAILDGPVDLTHPSLAGARLTQIATLVPPTADDGPASRHGTHVASIVFGQSGTSIEGIAPGCSGVIVPVFASGRQSALIMCSQMDLARAILQAVEADARVINISGGQLSASGNSDPLLEKAIQTCAERNVLVVAAAGNDGCPCLHVPAALETVLSVGAMDAKGAPLDLSNWGPAYQTRGILALGQDLLGAVPGGGIARRSGTSFATAVVSGVAALLLSVQLERGEEPDPHAVRRALIASATPCNFSEVADQRRCLAGRLNPSGALKLVVQGGVDMSDMTLMEPHETSVGISPSEAPAVESTRPAPPSASGASIDPPLRTAPAAVVAAEAAPPATAEPPRPMSSPGRIAPSDCGCGGGANCTCGGQKAPQLVYALGKINYDFGTEARRDTFAQGMPSGANPYDPAQLSEYIAANAFEAESLIWTLNLDATPIYAIAPAGPFAAAAYERLRQAFQAQMGQGVEMVSIPGTIGGAARLLSGQIVPAIIPAVRGMFSWGTRQLIASLLGEPPEKKADREHYDLRVAGLGNFLNRVYYDLRNLGVTPEERALNYAATNAFQAAQVMESATHGYLELNTVGVHKSPVCRPDSDCYDIEISFFDPRDTRVADKVYRFTVDVSDVMPVTIGDVRAWSRRA
jgi:cyanobactin maturation PatA/PatG family protease